MTPDVQIAPGIWPCIPVLSAQEFFTPVKDDASTTVKILLEASIVGI